jgi:hypothetical protein
MPNFHRPLSGSATALSRSDHRQSPTRADEYSISAQAYLERARARLAENSNLALFYAAFELRCCIEARQDSYVEAQKRYLSSIPQSYKIGKKAKELNKIFNRDLIAEIVFEFDNAQPITLYYTPVTTYLHNEAEKLGELLHCKQQYHAASNQWWDGTRDRLLKMYRGAWVCCRGNLLSPLMVDRKGNAAGTIEFYGAPNKALMDQIAQPKGTKFVLHVKYLDALPADWDPGL